jgi:hypothetical protein
LTLLRVPALNKGFRQNKNVPLGCWNETGPEKLIVEVVFVNATGPENWVVPAETRDRATFRISVDMVSADTAYSLVRDPTLTVSLLDTVMFDAVRLGTTMLSDIPSEETESFP